MLKCMSLVALFLVGSFAQQNNSTFVSPQAFLPRPGFLTLHWKSSSEFCYLSGPSKFIVPPQGLTEIFVAQDSNLSLECFSQGRTETLQKLFIRVDPFNKALALRVGPNQQFASLAMALASASPGSVIEVKAGTYQCAGNILVTQNDLKIVGVGGKVIFDEANCGGGRGDGWSIFKVTGRNVLLQNISFLNARAGNTQISAVRFEGGGLLYLKNCEFINCYSGLIALPPKTTAYEARIVIEESLFESNGNDNGLGHSIEVSRALQLLVKGCVLRRQQDGYYVRSLADQTYVLYNRMTDEEVGKSIHQVHLQSPQKTFILGNLLQKGLKSTDDAVVFISILPEDQSDQQIKRNFVVASNTIIHDAKSTHFPHQVLKVLENPSWQWQLSYACNNLLVSQNPIEGPPVSFPIFFDSNLLMGPAEFQTVNNSIFRSVGRYFSLLDGILINPVLEISDKGNVVARKLTDFLNVGANEWSLLLPKAL